MAYEDTVLLKLRRDYSKDEVVMFALNKIQELQIENGKNKSYIEELESEKREFGFWIKNGNSFKHTVFIKDLLNQIKTLKEQKTDLKKQVSILKSFDKISKIEHIGKKTDSLENKLKKQIEHGERMSAERTITYNFLKENVSELKIKEFYNLRDNLKKET
jgi:hypothetical protein